MNITYTIVEGYTACEFIKRVNQYIADGWEPLGGVAYGGSNQYFYQAMLLRVYSEDISVR